MPDLSIVLPSPALEEAFLRIVDPEEKLLAALESLGPVIDRDVIVLDCGNGFRARQLEEMGARVVAFDSPCATPRRSNSRLDRPSRRRRRAVVGDGRSRIAVPR